LGKSVEKNVNICYEEYYLFLVLKSVFASQLIGSDISHEYNNALATN